MTLLLRAALAVGLSLAAGAAEAQTSGANPSATPTSPAVPGSGPVAAPGSPVPMNVRTTADLVALCGTPQTDPGYPGAIGLCVGYGSGVLDYHIADTYRNKRARKVCIPQPPPTRGEARTAFIAWAQANPQYNDRPAVEGVMRFAIATWPCRR